MVKADIKNNKLEVYIILLFIPLLVGIASSIFTVDMMDAYELLNKPNHSFPSFVFPVVWSILYSLMGVGLVLVYKENTNSIYKKHGLLFSTIQLILNFAWSIIFFNYKNYQLAFICLVLLWLSVLMMLIYYKQVNKLAYQMNIPYIIWLTYAAYLNYFILLNN